jgi:hypothetical protein
MGFLSFTELHPRFLQEIAPGGVRACEKYEIFGGVPEK